MLFVPRLKPLIQISMRQHNNMETVYENGGLTVSKRCVVCLEGKSIRMFAQRLNRRFYSNTCKWCAGSKYGEPEIFEVSLKYIILCILQTLNKRRKGTFNLSDITDTMIDLKHKQILLNLKIGKYVEKDH